MFKMNVKLVKSPNVKEDILLGRQIAAGMLRAKPGEMALELFEATTETWEIPRHRPKFTLEVKREQKKTVLQIKMEGPAEEGTTLTVWQILNRGTRVRYMQLTDDWQSKTHPHQIFPGEGQGELLGIDKELPRPGIKAREWPETIAEHIKYDEFTGVEEAYDAAFDWIFS